MDTGERQSELKPQSCLELGIKVVPKGHFVGLVWEVRLAPINGAIFLRQKLHEIGITVSWERC
jgi:hypothetical protein